MNKEQMIAFLNRNSRAVELALVGLLARQTVGEQRTSSTTESNGRGFNARHAEFGTSLAKWVQSGRRLTSRQLAAARPMVCHYWRQVSTMPDVMRLVPPAPRPPITVTVIQGTDISYMLRQFDKFQQFA